MNPPYQPILSTHPIKPPYQPTLSTHPINFTINPPYQQQAIRKQTDGADDIKLLEYTVSSVTAGIDALGEVTVQLILLVEKYNIPTFHLLRFTLSSCNLLNLLNLSLLVTHFHIYPLTLFVFPSPFPYLLKSFCAEQVRLQDPQTSRIAFGKSANTDVIVASAQAYMNALNRLLGMRNVPTVNTLIIRGI